MSVTAQNNREQILELTSQATVEDLNTLLANLGIAAERVIAVHLVPGAGFASTPDKYRVLYRA